MGALLDSIRGFSTRPKKTKEWYKSKGYTHVRLETGKLRWRKKNYQPNDRLSTELVDAAHDDFEKMIAAERREREVRDARHIRRKMRRIRKQK